MEVLCRLSYSGVLLGARAMIPGTIEAPTPWDDERMRLAASLLLVAVACGSAAAPDPNQPTGLSIRTSGGTVTLEVQVADTLANAGPVSWVVRPSRPYDGMAFLWNEPVGAPFWMKDTLIPLSIAFWDDQGRIISILDMDPCTDDPCSSYGPGEPFVGAVEVGRGTFAMRGVAVGDIVELAVADA